MNKIEIRPAIKNDDLDEAKRRIIEMLVSKNKVTDVKVQEETKPIDEVAKRWNMNDRITNLFADKIEKDTKLKGRYAIILIVILIIQLIFLNVIFILKGSEVLSFSDTTFNIFITGGIAEIYVLVRIIVKYLFNDNLTELLKIIVRTNNKSSDEKYKGINKRKK